MSGGMFGWPQGGKGQFTSAIVKLGTIKLAAVNSAIDFPNIPPGFQHLQIRWRVKTTAGEGDLLIRFNADAANNYDSGQWIISFYSTNNDTAIRLGSAASSTAAGGAFTSGVLDILDYAETGIPRSCVSNSYRTDGGIGESYPAVGSGCWRNTTDAITRVQLLSSVGNLAVNSKADLYGIR